MSSASPPKSFEDELLSAIDAVYRFAVSLCRDTVAAEDLVQETYARALAHRHSYTPGTDCRAWLFAICRNLFLRNTERAQREVVSDDPELEAFAAAGLHSSMTVVDPEGSLFSRSELWEALDAALDELPEEYRTAVILVDVEDRSYAEAASVAGVPIGTLRSRLFRGRRLLQRRLLAFAQDAGLLPMREETL
jgi:RNA polymerase sigma-70 factor (ECF subfamily)